VSNFPDHFDVVFSTFYSGSSSQPLVSKALRSGRPMVLCINRWFGDVDVHVRQSEVAEAYTHFRRLLKLDLRSSNCGGGCTWGRVDLT